MPADVRAVPPRALVIASGNPLRGDDGAGEAVARILVEDPRLDGANVLSVVQLTPELALDVSEAMAVVFVDAGTDTAVGSVVVRDVRPTTDASAWTHHTTPESLVTLALALYAAGPPASLVTIGAAGFEPGDPLSPAVAEAVSVAAATVVHVLTAAPRAEAVARA